MYDGLFKVQGNSKLSPFPHSIDEENLIWEFKIQADTNDDGIEIRKGSVSLYYYYF